MNNKPSQQKPKVQNPKDYAIKLAQKEVPSYGASSPNSGEIRNNLDEELERELDEIVRSEE